MEIYRVPYFNIKDYHPKFESKGKLREYSTLSRLVKKQQTEIFTILYSGKLPDIGNVIVSEEEFKILDKFSEIYNDYMRTIDKIKKTIF
jgi:hypothetical protein